MLDGPGYVTLVGKPNPLKTETVCTQVQAGPTLAEMLKGARLEQLVVEVSGVEIPSSSLHLIRPKAGTTVTITQRLAGLDNLTQQQAADKTTAATIIHSIGTLALSFIPYVGPVLSAIAGPVGGIIISQIIKPAPIKKPPAPRTFYGIEGAKNEPRPYGAVPIVLGQVRMVPPLLAEVYSEWLGATSTFTFLLVDFGFGELSIDQELLDDTALSDYGANSRWLVGESPSWGVGDSYTTTPNKALPANGDPSADVPTETTQMDTDTIMVEIVWNQTFFCQNGDGSISSGQTLIDVYYRAVGDTEWFPVATMDQVPPTLDLDPGEVCVFTTSRNPAIKYGGPPATHFLIFGAQSPYEPLIVTIMFRPPTPGQYEVILSRSTLAQTGYSDVGGQWTKCRSVRSGTLPANLGTTKGSLSLKASQEISGTLGVLSARVGQIIPTWTGSAWVDAVSSNPAFIYRWLLTACPATLKTVSEDRLDDDTIKAWAEFCDTKGFVFNAVADTQMALSDLLTQVLAAGRATRAIKDGLYSVVFDDVQTTPVQMFTPRNSRNFRASTQFLPEPHGINCKFPNASVNQTDSRIVYADGYSYDGADDTLVADPKLLADMDFPGVTSPDAVWRLAKYHLATMRLRKSYYQFETGVENLVCQRGDRIKVAHDVMDWGSGWGRLTEALNLFMAFSTSLNDNAPWSGGVNLSTAGWTNGCRFTLAVDAQVVGVRVHGYNTETYLFKLWGESSVALAEVWAATVNGVSTIYFNVPVDCPAGEYCVTWYSDTYDTLIDNSSTQSHGAARQAGPLFIGNDAGVTVEGELNPIADNGGSRGYRIEPVVLAAANGGPGYLLGSGILQEVTLDETPVVDNLGLASTGVYALTIRPNSDPSQTSVYAANAVLANLARAIQNFTRASPTGSYIDENGKLQYTNFNNTIRQTYDHAGNFIGALLEQATTNYCLNSEDMSHGSWTKTGLSVKTNQREWANETSSADKIFATSSTGLHALECTGVTITDNAYVGGSVFLHTGTVNKVKVGIKKRDGTYETCTVDLSTGTITNDTSGTARCENYRDGWWRVSLIVNVGVGAGSTALVVRVLDSTGAESYAGAGESVYMVGAMLEKARAVTTYLPAGSVTNTRAGEYCNVNSPTKFGRKAGLNRLRGTVVFEIDNHSLPNSGEDVYLQLGDVVSAKAGIFVQDDLWKFGSLYSGAAEGPTVSRGRIRIAVSWEPEFVGASDHILRIAVNGAAGGTGIMIDGQDNILGLTDSEIFPTMGAGYSPGSASFTFAKLHAFDYCMTQAELNTVSVLDARIPKENSFWVGFTDATEGTAAQGDLALLGTPDRELKDLLVTSITPGPDLSATIECTDYDADVYSADSGTPPAFTSAITSVPYRERLEAPIFDDFVRCILAPDPAGTRRPPYTNSQVLLRLQLSADAHRIANIEVKWRMGYTSDTITYGDLGTAVSPVFTDWTIYGGISPEDVFQRLDMHPGGGTLAQITSGLFSTFYSGNAYWDVFARYVAADGVTSLWRHVRTRVWAHDVYSLAGIVGAQTATGGQIAGGTFALTPTVNGIDLSWTFTNPTILQNQIAHKIYRADDVGGSPGAYALIDTVLTQVTSVMNYRDPVNDGGTYWYYVQSTLTFSTIAPATSTALSAKSMSVTDGADVTGNAVQISVKNPNFEEGDISWNKGTGWSIVEYP